MNLCVDDLLCVTDDCQIWIVRDHHNLSALLSVLDAGHERSDHGLVVEVFFRLIDDQRDVVSIYK